MAALNVLSAYVEKTGYPVSRAKEDSLVNVFGETARASQELPQEHTGHISLHVEVLL